jgi:CBS-domain-containing membrane protein
MPYLGKTMGLCIAQGIGQISALQVWLKQALATALALRVTVKSGVIHPPAAAAAIVFSSGNTSWPPQVGIMLVGNVIAIFCATSIRAPRHS